MTRYLLDTTTLIDFSKDREPTRSRILSLIRAGDELGVCCINVAEFYTGIPPDKRAVWDEFMTSLTYWDMTREAAIRAGQDRFEFLRQGRTLSTPDALIAAMAQELRATLITENTKDYPTTDVTLLSLRE